MTEKIPAGILWDTAGSCARGQKAPIPWKNSSEQDRARHRRPGACQKAYHIGVSFFLFREGSAVTLERFFHEHPKAALAFSGGVDSAYLLWAGLRAGAEVWPYFVKTPFQPRFELEDEIGRAAGRERV